MWNGLVGNWRTTLSGLISGIATYVLAGDGSVIPTTKQGWLAWFAGLAQIAWGAVMKDASTGSKAVVS